MPFNREYLNGYPIVFRGIENEPIAAHKFTVLEKRGIRTEPFRYGDTRQQVIHHKDFDKRNNSDKNLMVMTGREHIALHASLGHPLSEEQKASISARMRANNPMKNPETVERVAAQRRGVPNPKQAERMRGNRSAAGKGLSQGGKIGGKPGHRVSEKSLEALRATHNHKVVSIEPLGIEDVYDMSVDEHHNFAAQGVFVHNCYMFYPEMRYVFHRMKEELEASAPTVAKHAQITCERKGVCTYRGAEDTQTCPIYPGSREWQSPLYDDRMLRLQAIEEGIAKVRGS